MTSTMRSSLDWWEKVLIKTFWQRKKAIKRRDLHTIVASGWLHDRTVLWELIGLLRRESHRERVQQGGLARINKSATLYSVLNIARRHHQTVH
jgi:hypothetical protein